MNGLDPYAGILLEMQDQSKKVQAPGWCLGTVITVEGGLRIKAGGQELDQEDLLVNPALLEGMEVPYSISVDLTAANVTLDIGGEYVRTRIQFGTTTISSIPLYTLPGTLDGTIKGAISLTESRLSPGDQVLLLPDREGQLYTVVCKVVKL